MKSLLIRGGRIIDPSRGIDETGDLLISGGKISRTESGSIENVPADCDILPAGGMVVCPGFIDLHCHLRQPGFESKETIATGSRAAARGGFSTICCMPNTRPPADNIDTLNFIKSEAEKVGLARVLPVACITSGRQGEELAPMKELAAAGAIGFSDDGDPVMDTGLMLRALRAAMETGLPLIEHCEDKGLAAGGVMNLGAVSRKLGLKGMPAAAEEIMVARNTALAGITGAHLHIAHASTAESVEIIRHARDRGIRVTAEVTPHHLTLTEDIITGYNTNAKVNPPLRTEKDAQALIKGLDEGVIDAIATDHAPHTSAEKQQPFDTAPFGIIGFETALGALMGLVHGGAISLNTLIAGLTCNPARVLGGGHGKIGTLEKGAPADVTVFDPEKRWLVETDDFASKGKNSPLAGARLRGKVMATVYGGKIVYRDDSLKIGENIKPKKGL
jgi:dihydroorotase